MVAALGSSMSGRVAQSSPTQRCSKLGAAGMLLPSMSAKIVGEGGELLGVGETGELVMKGPNVMQGYLELPEATAEDKVASAKEAVMNAGI